ncbi:MAG TPA: hypothetical protein VGL72_12510 [Bryobacteraceae bacterium]|jgi:hypothetical protein
MIKQIVLLFFCALNLSADTLVLTQGFSINGTVTFRDGLFFIEGTFAGEHRSSQGIPPEEVEEVCFNSFKSNSSAPPGSMGARTALKVKCELVLKDSKVRRVGTLQSITNRIALREDKETLPREKVVLLRIVH